MSGIPPRAQGRSPEMTLIRSPERATYLAVTSRNDIKPKVLTRVVYLRRPRVLP